jgi:transmembrane sensor
MVRDTIAEQASEWFVANDDATLDARESDELVAWLKASPVHVEEFLAVAAIAKGLHAAGTDPDLAVESLLARAEETVPVRSLWPRTVRRDGDATTRGWQMAATVLLALGVAGLGLSLWKSRMATPVAQLEAAALHFTTGHGEQKTLRLADASVLHLNTDSAVTVRYSATERLVVLTAGEADFEVAHQARAFRVLAGPAAIVDLGTRFDVRLNAEAAIVTVVEGRVAVAPAAQRQGGVSSVQLGANQQIRVADGQWPAAPIAVDAQQETAWLHRQIAFDHETLERVAAEYNRYAPKPIEITAAALRDLEVSGTFSTDDPEELLAFLRSLDGVQVEVTATQIKVSPSNAVPRH